MKRSGFKKKTYEEAPKARSQRAKTARRTKLKLKTKKAKGRTITSLKKQLDAIFSQYIRQKYADRNGNVSCFTCGVVKNWRELQNGHLVSRSYLATRFDEDNVRPQCVGCNIFASGRTAIFSTKIDETVGVGTTARLYRKAQEITKDFPYEEKIREYTEKLLTLDTNKTLE